jgi:hypothetical protein
LRTDAHERILHPFELKQGKRTSAGGLSSGFFLKKMPPVGLALEDAATLVPLCGAQRNRPEQIQSSCAVVKIVRGALFLRKTALNRINFLYTNSEIAIACLLVLFFRFMILRCRTTERKEGCIFDKSTSFV